MARESLTLISSGGHEPPAGRGTPVLVGLVVLACGLCATWLGTARSPFVDTAPPETVTAEEVGPLPDIPKRAQPAPPPPEPVRLASLPEELGRALSRIEDDELRKAITEAATTTLARERRKD